MWIPDYLYERLPLIYVAIGLFCFYSLGASSNVVLSTLALFIAALITVRRRRLARY
jgi:hypothetical protein